MIKTVAIIAGGGIGKRMQTGTPKQYLEILGRPMICHTLDRFLGIGEIKKIVIVLPEGLAPSFERDITLPPPPPLEGGGKGEGAFWIVTSGGSQRQDSVRNGLKLVPDTCDVVLVHDACRPFVTQKVINDSIKSAFENGAAIVAAPIKETIKEVSEKTVKQTVDRNCLWGAQTPQAFRTGILKRAYERAYKDGFYGTDDAMLVERIGGKVKIIEGDYRNIKITTPEDLNVAEAIAKSWQS